MPVERFNIELDEVSLVDKGANPGAKIALIKRANKDAGKQGAGNNGQAGGNNMPKSTEELTKQVDELKSTNEELTKKLEEANTALQKASDELKSASDKITELEKKMSSEGDGDDLNKRNDVPDDVKAMLKKSEDETKALNKRVEEMEKRERMSVALRKAEGYKNLPIKPDQFAPILDKMSDFLSDEEKTLMDTFMNAANETIGKIMKTSGKDDTGEGDKSAYDQLMDKAKDISKAENITIQKAFVRAKELHPELSKALREERVNNH